MNMKIKKPLIAIALTAGLMFSNIASGKEFKMAVGDAAGGTQYEMGQTFAKILNKKTNGKYRVDLFPGGQLGSEQDTVNNASMGTLDFSILAINNITPFSPTVGVLTLPYIIRSNEDAKKILEGKVGDELIQNTVRDANVRIIGWTYSGFRVLTNSKRPVKTLADLKGMIIRVPKNEIMISTYQAWGVNPTPMAWTETFTALQQKVVDGQDNPYITVAAMKFDEVQKYITNIHYVFSIEPLIVSEMIFQEQPKDVQAAILAAGKEATEHSYQYLLKTEGKIKADLQKKGVEISDPANGEKEWIEKATQTVWPKFYKSVGGKAKIDAIVKSLGH